MVFQSPPTNAEINRISVLSGWWRVRDQNVHKPEAEARHDDPGADLQFIKTILLQIGDDGAGDSLTEYS